MNYEIPCISASEPVDLLAEKHLYILIPFQHVQLNAAMHGISDRSVETKKKIAAKIHGFNESVQEVLESLYADGTINLKEKEMLLECVGNIEQYLVEKDAVVSQEVQAMGDENYVAWSDRMRAEGREEGRKEGREEGIEKGIEALILDGLEEQKTEQEIIAKLVKRFELTEAKAKKYFEKYFECAEKIEA